MNRDFEYMNYSESERLAMLENRAAELERRLGRVTPAGGVPEYHAQEHGPIGFPAFAPPQAGAAGYDGASHGGASDGFRTSGYGTAGYHAAGTEGQAATRYDPAEAACHTGAYPEMGAGRPAGPDERTEVLINRGRRNAKRGPGRWLAHWRAIALIAGAVAVGATLIAVVLPGGGGAWPASVARVQSQIAIACQNPNVVSEPSQVNFACAKDTRQILWVFSLLTSGNNPAFTDSANGRKGLEPIAPTQGGNIAWSLNLHHPYDPASPTDSLQVAARAINNIIGGATVTGTSGAPVVQAGLESSPANCARYTGSAALVTRQGFPALCALPVNTPEGQAALVSDVFQQWMVGTPSQVATEAGVLFENANNPGDPRVQSILNSLPTSGL